MARRYAESTSVSSDKSIAEIKTILQRYGAIGFMYAETGTVAMVQFDASNRRVQFVLPLPDRKAKEFWYTPSRNTRRTEEQAYEAWEQSCRQRWRALALAIKAKLEAVASGITTFENEFLAHIVVPGTSDTVGKWISSQLATAYETGKMPPLLPMGTIQ